MIDGWNLTITKETEMKGQRKAKRHTQPAGTRKKGELVPLVEGSYLTHSPSSVVCLQILKWVIVYDEAFFRFGVLLGFPSIPLSNLLHTTKPKV
jgi:hypothetical protein